MRRALVLVLVLACRHDADRPQAGSATIEPHAVEPHAARDLAECQAMFDAIARLQACPAVPAGEKERFAGTVQAFGDAQISPEMSAAYLRDTCIAQLVDLRSDGRQAGCDLGIPAAIDAAIEHRRGHRTQPPSGLPPEHAEIFAKLATARDRACACPDKACAEAAMHEAGALDVSWVGAGGPEVNRAYDGILHETVECVLRPGMRVPAGSAR